MSLTFNKRTYTMYVTLKKRGPVGCTIVSFRIALERQIEKDSECRYCKTLLMLKNVSADHRLPISRGGRNLLSNIDFICKSCNKAKSDFSSVEFEYLLSLLDQMEKKFKNFPAKRRVLSALRISNSFRQGRMRRDKSVRLSESKLHRSNHL
jgi:hypothetical protein